MSNAGSKQRYLDLQKRNPDMSLMASPVWEEFDYTKGVIRIRKSKKDRQHNDQYKNTNNDLQNTTQKAKDGATRTHWKPEVNSGAANGLAVPAAHVL